MDISQKVTHDSHVIQERQEKIFSFLKKNIHMVAYLALAFIVFLAVRIRTANLSGLKDITTGDWTLGPDLDPFLFLRWADYIAHHGSLMALDTMRYVPIGFDTTYELVFHVHLMAWFHQVTDFLWSWSTTQSAVIYPVFMFALAVIAFFMFVRKAFLLNLGENKASIIALIASFFLSVIPVLLPRTIAGIPEKEASALVFLFLAFYFFIAGWESNKKISSYVHALLAGISTALMGLVWGGYLYILITIGPLMFFLFILGKVDKNKKYFYSIWVITMSLILFFGTNRYPIVDLLTSTTTLPCFFMFFLFWADSLFFDTKISGKLRSINFMSKLPRQVTSFLLFTVLGIIAISIVMGPTYLLGEATTLKKFLVTTAVDRVSVTVAENRQPYFIEWAGNFGPHILNTPLMFWIFFFAAIYMFYIALKPFKDKDRKIATGGFVLFLISIIFSRYSGDSLFNGTNGISLIFYALGPLILVGLFGKYFMQYYKSSEEERLKHIDFNYMFLIWFFLISLISARGGVRLVMMLVPSISILMAYLPVELISKAKKSEVPKRNVLFAIAGIVVLALLFAGYQSYQGSYVSAQNYVPGGYNQQWQKAMSWVRDSTPANAVFGHWWDYGYWLQSIGNRATVLDGGNAKAYWNHMMGRYALTGTSNREALDFLYAHNTTHFLIDSSDIGKYNAFSTIGSNKDYDRASYITAFVQNMTQVQETKNSTLFIYYGGFPLDADLIYEMNGTKIFLPSGQAGLGAIVIEVSKSEGKIINSPKGVFIYQGQQYTLPIRYAYDNGILRDFGEGVDSGIFLMPMIYNSNQGLQVNPKGALFYLSSRTVNSQLARLYLYNENNSNFKLVHTEDDFLVAEAKANIPGFTGDFIYYGGFRGPIKIWEINYPSDMEFNKEYLREDWPPELFYA